MRNVNYNKNISTRVNYCNGFFNLNFFTSYRSFVVERYRLSCQFGGGIEYNYRIGVGRRGRKER